MPKKAHAEPTKDFFVTKIVRDITLEDCILDLIDNCLDGARKDLKRQNKGADDYKPYRASITLNGELFRIADNCGGISTHDAVNYAFHFGRPPDAPAEADFPIGLYGIGMKRAIFKIGNRIKIFSSTTKDAFSTEINVNEWLRIKEWEFELTEGDVSEQAGTIIEIIELWREVSAEFRDDVFAERLRKLVARDYSFFLERGFGVEVNGTAVAPYRFALKRSGDFEPASYSYTDPSGVKVDIVAGMAGLPPDDSSAEVKRTDTEYYGWFVGCNDRIVLAADKSALTVWGHEGFADWHPQYNGFMGILNFHSADPKLLPWTTTKREVEQQDQVYRRARVHMKRLTEAYIKYTRNRRADLDLAKRLERSTEAIPINRLVQRENIKVPQIAEHPAVQLASIQYTVEVEKVKEAAEALGNRSMSYKRVGLKTFQYFYDNEVAG